MPIRPTHTGGGYFLDAGQIDMSASIETARSLTTKYSNQFNAFANRRPKLCALIVGVSAWIGSILFYAPPICAGRRAMLINYPLLLGLLRTFVFVR